MGKCIITKDTPGIKENFTDQENIYLVNNTPESIADAILDCKANTIKSERIAQAGYKLVKEKYNEIEVAKKFVAALELINN